MDSPGWSSVELFDDKEKKCISFGDSQAHGHTLKSVPLLSTIYFFPYNFSFLLFSLLSNLAELLFVVSDCILCSYL